tara:strand:- start:266 stop:532 length:267 start_codon:yes stop_codon:yes gene_type:complete
VNDPIKIGAVVSAVLLIGSQYLPQLLKLWKSLLASIPTAKKKQDGIVTDDLSFVLDLAMRLGRDGNEKATELAKQLLDAMLDPPEVKK